MPPPDNVSENDESILAPTQNSAQYLLRLYVTGLTPRSTESVARIKAICDEHLPGRYDLEVIDIYQQPALARGDQIVATPTLIKKLPLPLRRLVGDLTNKQRVMTGLGLREV